MTRDEALVEAVFSNEGLDPKKSQESLLVVIGAVLGVSLLMALLSNSKTKKDKKEVEKIYNEHKDIINEKIEKVYEEYKDTIKNVKQSFTTFCKNNWKNKPDLLKYCTFEKLLTPDQLTKELISYSTKEDLTNCIIGCSEKLFMIDLEKYGEKEEKIDYDEWGKKDSSKHNELEKTMKQLLNGFKKQFDKYQYIDFEIETNPDDYYLSMNVMFKIDYSALVNKIEKKNN